VRETTARAERAAPSTADLSAEASGRIWRRRPRGAQRRAHQGRRPWPHLCYTPRMTLPHHNLAAWQRADDLFINIHALTQNVFPREERYELSSQLRRAAYSVPANIVGRNAAQVPERVVPLLQHRVGVARRGRVWATRCSPTWVSDGRAVRRMGGTNHRDRRPAQRPDAPLPNGNATGDAPRGDGPGTPTTVGRAIAGARRGPRSLRSHQWAPRFAQRYGRSRRPYRAPSGARPTAGRLVRRSA